MKYVDSSEIKAFFIMLNNNDIEYVLVKNIGDELPYSLEDGKGINILVHPDSKSEFERSMQEGGFEKKTHTFGIENGWTFGYSMLPYQFWMKKNKPFTLYIDASFVLSCKSLMPKVCVPLKEHIDESIWKEKVFDIENNWWIIDDKNMLLYLLVRSIFDKKVFTEAYVNEIEKRKHHLNDIKYKLHVIFFTYTSRLTEMVATGKYSDIIQDYVTFDEY